MSITSRSSTRAGSHNSLEKTNNLSSSSIASHSTLASRDSILPEYEKLQSSLDKKVLAGRHPKSFKIASELASQCKLSNERVSRISKGHSIWTVIDEQTSLNNNMNHKIHYHQAYSDYQSTRVKIKQYIIDLSNDCELFYGNNVIIITSMDEILCVDNHGCIICKEVDDLKADDKIVFRILNMYDISSPEKFIYGSKFWLQVVPDDAINDHSEENFHESSVLCAKVFDSPNMNSLVSTKTYISNHDVYEKKTNSNATKINARHTKKNSPYICGGLTCINTVETRTTVTELKADSLFESLFHPNKGDSLNVHKKDTIREVKSYTYYKSKAAQSLGSWKVQTAMNNLECEGETIRALSPIYMSQDLYCFATSHGAGYKPWPSSLKSNQNSNIMAIVKFHEDEEVDENMLAEFNPRENQSHTGESETSPPNGRVEVKNEYIYGCLRKTVIRDKSYSNAIDRRCMWRFCAIENARVNTAGHVDKGVTETHDVIDNARTVLKVSEETRKGLRRKYDDQKLIDGRSLPGGEAFCHSLRLIKSDFALLNTTYYALPTRDKERNPRNYYENKLMHQIFTEEADGHRENDTISNLSYSQYSTDDYLDDRSVNSEELKSKNSTISPMMSPIAKNSRHFFNNQNDVDSFSSTSISSKVSSKIQDRQSEEIQNRQRLDSRVEQAIMQPDALQSPGESMISLHKQLEAMNKKALKAVKTEIETKILIEKGLFIPKETTLRSKAEIIDPMAVERKMNAFKLADALMSDAILHRERDNQTKRVADLFQQIK